MVVTLQLQLPRARSLGGEHSRVIEGQLGDAHVGLLPPLDRVRAGLPVMADVQVLGEGEVRPADTRGLRISDMISFQIREVRKGRLGQAQRGRSGTLE